MPKFIQYAVEYTNTKPYRGFNIGPGKMTISLPEGCKSVKAKLKRTVERNINSLGVRIDFFKEIES